MRLVYTLLLLGPIACIGLDVASFRKYAKPSNSFRNISKEKCAVQQELFSAAIDKGDEWALKMLDSSGNIPSGLYSGNSVDMGFYDECLYIAQSTNDELIKGKYCYGGLVLPLNRSNEAIERDAFIAQHVTKLGFWDPVPPVAYDPTYLIISLCIPDACLPTDIFGDHGLNTMCTTDETTFDNGDIMFIVFIALMATLLCLSTVYDIHLQSAGKNATFPIMLAFSVNKNGKGILQTATNSDQISCFNGLRVLSSFLVISCHRYMATISSRAINIHAGYDLWKNLWPGKYMTILLPLAVDNFFFMSGVLLSYNFLLGTQKSKTKLDILKIYRHRFFRLVPALMVVFFFQVTLARRLGSGPTWNPTMDNIRSNCLENWWSVLFFLNSYNKAANHCLGHTWTVATDVHMFLLSPLLLLPLIKNRASLTYFISGAIFISMLIPLIVCYIYDVSFPAIQFFEHYYQFTHNRSSPWFIGFAFGLIIFNYKIKNGKPELNQLQNYAMWCLVLFVIMVLPVLEHTVTSRDVRFEKALFYALHRSVWSLCLCWITFACIFGYGGIVNRFLSAGFFQVLAKISYCTYIIHWTLLYINVSYRRTLDYFGVYSLIYSACGDVMIAYTGGYLLALAIELPFAAIERAIFGSGSAKVVRYENGCSNNVAENNNKSKKSL